MVTGIVTKEDLDLFREELIREIKALITPPKEDAKKWLRHKEVMALLGISTNTLQRLRACGKLPSSKVGGAHYYRYEDIEKLFGEVQ
jgi:hypothetical protein